MGFGNGGSDGGQNTQCTHVYSVPEQLDQYKKEGVGAQCKAARPSALRKEEK